jgi:ankyrin repeat protein
MMGTKLFLQAVQEGKIEQVSRMLEDEPELAGARTESGLSGLLLAAYYGQLQIARLLANHRGHLTLFEACVVGDLAAVKALTAGSPALINSYSPDGFHPLGLAAFFNQPAVARYLVENGAEVNRVTENPQHISPLISATASGSLEIARLLLEHGADPNARQAGGFTAMHNAAQNGQLEMIELLLKYHAEANPRADDGRTALTFALEANRAEAAALLRGHGAGA